MKKIVVALALAIGFCGAAHAASITSFSSTSNTGVWTLSTAQQGLLGTTADRIGALRLRNGSTGDTFDATSVLDTAANLSSRNKILGVLNGSASAYAYTGNEFDALGITTLLQDYTGPTRFDFDPGVYFLFDSTAGNVVFVGTSTFNGGQTTGEFPGLAPVPLPAAAWMLLVGVGGLAAVGRRKRAASAAA